MDGVSPPRRERDEGYEREEATREKATTHGKRLVEERDLLAGTAMAERPTVLARDAFANPALRAAEAVVRRDLYEELAALGDKSGCGVDDSLAVLVARRAAMFAALPKDLFGNPRMPGTSAMETFHAAEAKQRRELEEELVKLGDQRGCGPGDTIATLGARRDKLRADTVAARIEEVESRIYTDGRATGTLSHLRAVEVMRRCEAMNPGTGTGVLAAGIAAMNGRSLEEIQSAGEQGNAGEAVAAALADAAGHGTAGLSIGEPELLPERELEREGPLLKARPRMPEHEATPSPIREGPLRVAPIAPLVRAETVDLEPVPRSAESATPIERSPLASPAASPAHPAKVKATFLGAAERIDHARLAPEERAFIEELLAKRDAARTKLEELEAASAPKGLIDAARNAMGLVSEQIGEIAASATIRAKFPGPPAPVKLWPPAGTTPRGGEFDQVWRVAKDGKPAIAVVEAKGGSGKLGTRVVGRVRVQQGTKLYFANVRDEMLRDPSSADVAIELRGTRDPIFYIEARTPIRESVSRSAAGRTMIRQFDLGGRP